jgi:hypothetical protein
MIIGMIFLSMGAYFINSYWSNKLIQYSVIEQLLDITPSFLIAMATSTIMFLVGTLISAKSIVIFFIQFSTGGVFLIFLGEIFKLAPYTEIKQIIISNIKIPLITKK